MIRARTVALTFVGRTWEVGTLSGQSERNNLGHSQATHPHFLEFSHSRNDLPEPNNSSELASFQGATNFYLKFVGNYDDVAEPLHMLLRQDISWKWTNEQMQTFQSLKRKITSAPILEHFDPNTPMIVNTDVSGIVLGAVLSQVSNAVERPVAHASKTLSETE